MNIALVLLLSSLLNVFGFGVNENPSVIAARRARDHGDTNTLKHEIENAEKSVKETKALEAYLRLALLQDWMCEAAEAGKDKQLQRHAAEAGVAAAEAAIRINPASSQAHQLLADLLGQLAPLVMGGGMKYGQRSTNEADKAIELDPKNADAYITRGISYLYTPEAFGGDKKKAVECFTKALHLAPELDTPHIWLALFNLEAGSFDEALGEINEARRLNPERGFSQEVLREISSADKKSVKSGAKDKL